MLVDALRFVPNEADAFMPVFCPIDLETDTVAFASNEESTLEDMDTLNPLGSGKDKESDPRAEKDSEKDIEIPVPTVKLPSLTE